MRIRSAREPGFDRLSPSGVRFDLACVIRAVPALPLALSPSKGGLTGSALFEAGLRQAQP
jgi:hypothetical protein